VQVGDVGGAARPTTLELAYRRNTSEPGILYLVPEMGRVLSVFGPTN
jgi:hypothetical protein